MPSVLFGAIAAALVVTTAHAQTPPRGGKPIVIGQSYVVHSTALNTDRTINIYLPQDYGDPKRTFPVLYLLDGGEDGDFHHITGLVQVSGAYGATQEMIVVGIAEPQRRHDLTTPSADPADQKLIPTAGGAAEFRRFLVQDLKPWVAQHYRINGHSALMGESLAGLFVTETFLRAPDSFDDYIAASPSLWWEKQTLSKEAEADLRTHDYSGKRFWMAMEDEGPEFNAPVDRVVAALKTVNPRGLSWTYDPRTSERHDSIYHPVAMTALRTLYAVKK